MQRTTIAIDDELAAALDAYMDSTGAGSRSEAIRDLVRRGLSARPEAPAEAPAQEEAAGSGADTGVDVRDIVDGHTGIEHAVPIAAGQSEAWSRRRRSPICFSLKLLI